MKTITPLSKKTLVQMSDRELVEYGIKVGCYDFPNRKEAEDNVYKAHFRFEKKREVSFWDIRENPEYFEIFHDEEIFDGWDDFGHTMHIKMSGRRYFLCEKCGYITKDDCGYIPDENMDNCKCGGCAQMTEFSFEQYEKIVEDKKNSDFYGLTFKEEMDKDHANFVDELVDEMGN